MIERSRLFLLLTVVWTAASGLAQEAPLPARAIVRLGTSRWTADSASLKLAFSADDAFLYSSGDGVQKWDAKTGARVESWPLSFGDLLDLSADGNFLIIGSSERSPRLIDCKTGKVVRPLQKDPACVAAFSPDNKTFVCALQDERTLVVRDLTTGEERGRLEGADARLRVLAFSPDGRHVAASEHTSELWDGNVGILIWEVASAKLRTRTHSPNQGMTSSLSFSADGRRLIVGSLQRVRIFDIESGRSSYVLGHQARRQVAVHPKENWLVAAGEGVLWDLNTDARLGQLQPRHESIGTVAISHDGKTIATANASVYHVAIDLWDARTGKLKTPGFRHRAEVEEIAFSRDGRSVATRSPQDGTILLWNADNGKPLHKLEWGTSPFATTGTFGFTVKGNALLAGGRRWNAGDHAPLDDVVDTLDRKERHGNTSSDRRFEQIINVSSDGRYAADLDMRRRVRVWRVKDQQILFRVEPLAPMDARAPIRFTFAPDSKTLVVAHQYDAKKRVPSIRLFDVETTLLKTSYRPELFHIFHLQCTPDGERLIVSGTNGVELRQLATGDLLQRWAKDPRDTPRSSAVAVSPDSRVIAFESDMAAITLAETATGKTIDSWPAQSGPVRALAFSPDGRRLASGSRDSSALIWHVSPQPDSGKLLKTKTDDELWTDLAGDGARAYAVVFALASDAARARAVLEKRLTMVPKAEEQQILKWIKDQDDKAFKTREEAAVQLRQRGAAAAPYLRKALREPFALETRRRLEDILRAVETQAPTPDYLRDGRALQILEMLATPEARRQLASIAQGAATSPRTTWSQAALTRLAKR